MRMRRKKHGAERIAACAELLIKEPAALKNGVSDVFPEERHDVPVCLEIGCGKGSFACGLCAKDRGINLIAMERVSDVACLALEKAKDQASTRPDNLRFLIGDAKHLSDYFPENSISKIYINFCDPWPKKGYAKRRLTYHSFLELYRNILIDGGKLVFKTDNESLFDFSIEEFKLFQLEILWSSRDLHASERAEDNIMTEYEANFSSQGMPIYCAEVVFRKRSKMNDTLSEVKKDV